METLFVVISILAIPMQDDLAAGDTVTLVHRAQHIPGHPGDGMSPVSVRFRSGSTAVVSEIGNWVKITGESVTGESGTAWIVRKYISSKGTTVKRLPPTTLDWCPDKGSPAPHPSGRLRIATWNIATLHSQIGESVFPNSVARQSIDYERIRCYSRMLDADIVAVQEVDGREALARVFDTDVYNLHVSSRNGNMNTGFAYKRGLTVAPRTDYSELDVQGVRYGARIDVTCNGKTIRLMSVHLKSGCFTNSSDNTSACTKLKKQIPILESWIDEAATSEDAFIVLGDFNRRLNMEGDHVWNELDDGSPANADLVIATKDMPISCRDNRYTEFIDHIVLGKRAAKWMDPTAFRHMTYRQQDRDFWDAISDHCPIAIELWIE